MKLDFSKARVLRVHLGAVIAIHVVNVATLWMRYLADDFRGRQTIVDFFSVSSEGKLPTWFSGLALIACGAVLAVIATDRFRARDSFRFHWGLLSGLFFYISFDEVTHVHEEIGPVFGNALGATGFLAGWVVPGMIVLGALGVIFSRFLLTLPRRSRNLFIVAAVIYIGGALGMELVGSIYQENFPRDIGYGIIATIEEVLEMVGIVVFLYALLDHVEREVGSTISIELTKSPTATG